MIDYDILEEYGTTNSRMREFFTAEPFSARKLAGMRKRMSQKECDAAIKANEKDCELRKKFEDQINSWLNEHILFSLKNYHRYAAIDLAWDSSPINKYILPLMMYAQGRINTEAAEKALAALPEGSTYIKKESGKTTIDLPKFTEVNINLIRSAITRRVASQAVKYDSLWPFFKYESRSTTQVGKLCADLTSQRMDIMADQYGYRHHQTQVIRDMLLYPSCTTFPRASWERDVQIERDRSKSEAMVAGAGKIPKRTRVVREGIAWVNPHPSRVFFDNNYPLASLNTDTGCEYVGFWDVCRWADIENNLQYFNRNAVSFSADAAQWYQSYVAYFNQYYDKVSFPGIPENSVNPSGNDRKNNVGFYTGELSDASCFFTHVWRKIIPQEWGIGTYPHPIWVHLKVAGDSTVVYADIFPSSPAAVFSYNTNDGRMSNISVAEELMPYQDQLTNLFSQFLEIVKADLFSVAVLNTDVFPDTPEGKAVKEEFRKLMAGKNFYAQTQILEVSLSKLQQLNIDVGSVFKVVRSHPNTALDSVLKAIVQTIALADRLMVMSQHEQGQVAPHEISATESNQLAGSVETVYAFISNAIDEGRSAMKRICYESLIAKGSDDIHLTAINRYPRNVIEKAGFTIVDTDLDAPLGYFTLIGKKHSLDHDYIFTTRDGGDRSANQQGATVLVQLMQAIAAMQPTTQNAILSAMGKEKLFEIMNTIFRMADAGVDLKLESKPGDDDSLLLEDDQQVMGLIAQITDALKRNIQDVQQLKQIAGVQQAA